MKQTLTVTQERSPNSPQQNKGSITNDQMSLEG